MIQEKRIYPYIGHRLLKKNFQPRKHAIASISYAYNKGQASNKNKYTGENSRDIPSLKESISTINTIPIMKSELLVPFVCQAKGLHKTVI